MELKLMSSCLEIFMNLKSVSINVCVALKYNISLSFMQTSMRRIEKGKKLDSLSAFLEILSNKFDRAIQFGLHAETGEKCVQTQHSLRLDLMNNSELKQETLEL